MVAVQEASVYPEGFQYKSLDTNRQEIRVLDVEPGRLDGLVIGTLRHVSLTASPRPRYETVSYVWGDSTRRAKVVLDGCLVDVAASSVEAFQNLRSPTKRRTLWIDALCIDQNNIQERTDQVSLMGLIYSSTQRTLVWLGQADEETHTAFSEVGSFLQEMMDDTAAFKNLEGRIIDQRGTVLVPEGAGSLTWEAAFVIQAIYSRPWFQRVWVMQEAALAAECTCFCGLEASPILELLRVALWICHKFKFEKVDTAAEQRMDNVLQIWRVVDKQHGPIAKSEGRTLENVLGRKFIGFGASDPRDHIYALLGLTMLWPAFTLPRILIPDYIKTVAEAFRDATTVFIENDRTLRPFRYVYHFRVDGLSDLNSDRPSWVPHWDRDSDHSARSISGKLFCAGRISGQMPEVSRREESPYILYLTIVLVDRIRAVDEPWTESVESWIRQHDRIFGGKELLARVLSGCSDTQSFNAVARTLCGVEPLDWASLSKTYRLELGERLRWLTIQNYHTLYIRPLPGRYHDFLLAIERFVEHRLFFPPQLPMAWVLIAQWRETSFVFSQVVMFRMFCDHLGCSTV